MFRVVCVSAVVPVIDYLKANVDDSGHYSAFFKNGFVEARAMYQVVAGIVAGGLVLVFATEPAVILCGRVWQLIASVVRKK